MNKAYIRFPEFKNKALTLSYDDGVRQDKRLIGIMQEYGLKGTFNINGGLFSEAFDGRKTTGRMTVDEALELYNSSNSEVALHGYNHLSLPGVNSALAVNDIVSDRAALEEIFGRIINGMAYANGAYDDNSVEILKQCGISYARTTVSTEKFDIPSDWLRMPATCHHDNPRLMQLAERFIEGQTSSYWWAQTAKLFYLWGHSYEFDDNDNWHVIEEFAAYMGNRREIWYATNGEIFEYIQACNRLVFSINSKIVYNPTVTDVYINWFGKNVLIPAGKTVTL